MCVAVDSDKSSFGAIMETYAQFKYIEGKMEIQR
jgi:hypothetical protein